MAWGEHGQHFCSFLKGDGFLWSKGFATGIAGGSISTGVSFMPGPDFKLLDFTGKKDPNGLSGNGFQGFKNVGSDHRNGGKVVTTSISVGAVKDIGLILITDQDQNDENNWSYKLDNAIKDFRKENSEIWKILNVVSGGITASLAVFVSLIAKHVLGGLVGVGVLVSYGVDVLDLASCFIGDPDVSHVYGSELILQCSAKDYAKDCTGKVKFQLKQHGERCLVPLSCFECSELATPWYGHQDHANPLVL